MIILALRTDTQETRMVLLENHKIISDKKWDSGRSLAKGLPQALKEFLYSSGALKIEGYIGYLGPGSFTGLRIGLSSLNAMAYTKNLPIIGSSGENWLKDGVDKLLSGESDKVLIPQYGAGANITLPKK